VKDELIHYPYLVESGPENMARDLYLFETSPTPWTRTYGWASPTISFGCTQRWSEVQSIDKSPPPGAWVRRPTGGGRVVHGSGITHSLFVPADHALGQISPSDFYCRLHHALRDALQSANPLWELRLVACAEATSGSDCFTAPVAADIIDTETGIKIAGAGLKRSRQGILCQGEIQLPPDRTWGEEAWLERWSKELAAAPQAAVLQDTERLEELRKHFASKAWLEKR
jgi:lipoate-protein ligase A